jgi:hypothetical protein
LPIVNYNKYLLKAKPTREYTLIKSFAGDSKGGGFSKEPPLAAGGTGVAGWAD